VFNDEHRFLDILRTVANSLYRIAENGITINLIIKEEVQDAAHGQKPDPILPAMPKE
jgi:hypothetical protein